VYSRSTKRSQRRVRCENWDQQEKKGIPVTVNPEKRPTRCRLSEFHTRSLDVDVSCLLGSFWWELEDFVLVPAAFTHQACYIPSAAILGAFSCPSAKDCYCISESKLVTTHVMYSHVRTSQVSLIETCITATADCPESSIAPVRRRGVRERKTCCPEDPRKSVRQWIQT